MSEAQTNASRPLASRLVGRRKLAALIGVLVVATVVGIIGGDLGLAIGVGVLLLVLGALGVTIQRLGRQVERLSTATTHQNTPHMGPRAAREQAAAGNDGRTFWAGFREAGWERLSERLESGTGSPAALAMATVEVARIHADRGELDRALELARSARMLDETVNAEVGARSIEADLLVMLDRTEAARRLLEAHSDAPDETALRVADTYALEDPSGALDADRLTLINSVFLRHGMSQVRLRDRDRPLSFDNLGGTARPGSVGRRSAPLVSVIMPAHDSAPTIDYALRSVLEQTWRNLDIVVVDDGSADSTVDAVEAIAQRDPRVRIERQSQRGAYAARNAGLRLTRGEFVTVHDADDWSHPEKIERQVRSILDADPTTGEQPRASWSSMIRANEVLQFCEASIQLRPARIVSNYSSLMVPRAVLDEIGPWDEVAVGADSEFVSRIRARWGRDVVRRTDLGVPLSFVLRTTRSLTSSGPTSIRSIWHVAGARKLYREAFEHWHGSPRFLDDLPLSTTPGDRPFPCPQVVDLDARHRPSLCDVLVITDCTPAREGLTGLLQLLDALDESSLSTRILNIPASGKPANAHHEVADRLRRGSLAVVCSGEEVTARTVIVESTAALTHRIDQPPLIHSGRTLVVRRETDELSSRLVEERLAAFGIDSLESAPGTGGRELVGLLGSSQAAVSE